MTLLTPEHRCAAAGIGGYNSCSRIRTAARSRQLGHWRRTVRLTPLRRRRQIPQILTIHIDILVKAKGADAVGPASTVR